MFYIHQTSCISPQETFSKINFNTLHHSAGNKLNVMEPVYTGIQPGMLRRMGKSSRISVGTALEIIKQGITPDGIIIGTANGSMEESAKFLREIIEYNEDMLAPGSFVQGTPNSIASQIALLSRNYGYNITHVHKAHSFENAAIDTAMLLRENPGCSYLLGGGDEISSYNFNIDLAAGWYKKDTATNINMYDSNSPGSIAGEGAAMFIVNNEKSNAVAKLQALSVLHTEDENKVKTKLQDIIKNKLTPGEKIDLFLTGENGDNRHSGFYTSCEEIFGRETTIARFKHMCGEYPTASSFGLWLACHIPMSGVLPKHMVKREGAVRDFKNVLLYNTHQGVQHSFILVSKFK